MMEDAERILLKIKAFATEAKRQLPKRGWVPPVRENFRPAQILCFDQTLSHCGWAILATDQEKISVPACGVIVAPKFAVGERGFAATFTKSILVAEGMKRILRDNLGSFEGVVAEMPAVAGYRTESSLVAAVTLVQTLHDMGEPWPEFVSRNRAASVLCGDRAAPKGVTGAFVDQMVQDRHPKPWNEHVRDAVFVGLQSLHKEIS
jgi:hypothetical protein